MDTRDDRELFAVMGGGGVAARTALEELYRRHAAAVLAFLRRAGGPGVDAEDLLHDTFLAAFRASATFLGGSSSAWLATLALNRLRDRRRAEARRRRRERRAARPEIEEAEADHSGLEAAIDALPDPLREVVALRHFDGLTHEQVAQVLGVSLRTAKQRSADALARLRQLLEES